MLYVYESGPETAPAIVLLHGGGLSGRMWQPQIERLTEYHCIVPDLPAQGKSVGSAPFTLDGAARDIAEIIQTRAAAGRAAIVGISLGGAVGLEIMRTTPVQVDHLIVSGTSGRLSRFLGLIMNWTAGLYRLMKPETLANSSYKQMRIPEQYRDDFMHDLVLSSTPQFIHDTAKALMSQVLPEQATAPTLVCVGEQETLPAKQAARQILATVKGSRGVLVPGAGHLWNLQKPDLFTQTIEEWITNDRVPEELKPL